MIKPRVAQIVCDTSKRKSKKTKNQICCYGENHVPWFLEIGRQHGPLTDKRYDMANILTNNKVSCPKRLSVNQFSGPLTHENGKPKRFKYSDTYRRR